MGRSSSDELRNERLQSLMVLGLLADDVALAAIHYPTLSEREVAAVQAFERLLDDVERNASASREPFPPRRSMADPAAVLSHTAELVAEVEPGSPVTAPDLRGLREPLRRLLTNGANEAETKALQRFCQLLGSATLRATENVIHEKGTEEWTERVSLFSAA